MYYYLMLINRYEIEQEKKERFIRRGEGNYICKAEGNTAGEIFLIRRDINLIGDF